MLTRKSGILALVAGALVLGACEQKAPIVNIPPVTNPVTVTIAGAPTNPIKKGATVQLVAIVANTTNQAVTWSLLSGTGVVSVSSTGLVTALLPGTAVIQAVSQADPTAKAAVSIQVADTAVTGGGTVGQPSITIGSVTQFGTTNPVNPGNVFGTIDVTMNVDIPTGVKATALQLAVKNLATGATVNVPCQTFSATGSSDASVEGAQAPQTVICSVPTGQLTNGVPTFPNGQYTITAQLMNGTAVIASATTQTLIFANADALNVTATASGATALDAAGLQWATGDLTVKVTPAIFSTTTAPTSVTVTVRDNGTDNAGAIIAQKTVTTSTGGVFSVTFTKAAATTGTDDVSEAEGPISIQVTSVLAGQPGPTFANSLLTPNLRLDNQAPDDTNADATVTSFNDATNLWYGANTTISASARVTNRAEMSDEGVNTNTWTFQYNANPAATNSTSGWTTFTSPTELPQTTTTNGFRVRAIVCDALGNCSSGFLSTASGGDVTPPTIAVVSKNDVVLETAAEMAAAGEVVVSGTENLSGFPANFVQFTMKQVTSNASSGTKCWDGAAFIALPASGVCPTVSQASTTVDIPGATNGYYIITVWLIDQAGNTSSTVGDTFLFDNTVPTATVSGLAFASGNITVNGTVTDNVDLRGWDVQEQFTGANILGAGLERISFTNFTADGSFGLPLTTSVTASGTAPLIRQVNGSALTNAGFGAIDVANNYGFGEIAFGSPTPGDGIDNAVAVGLTNPAVTASSAFICKTGTSAACGSSANVAVTSTTISYVPVTNANTANPISVVYFYAMVPASNGGNYPLLIGTDNTADLTINTPGNTRNWTYTQTLTTALVPPITAFSPAAAYNVTVFALALDAQNDGVTSAGAVVQVR